VLASKSDNGHYVTEKRRQRTKTSPKQRHKIFPFWGTQSKFLATPVSGGIAVLGAGLGGISTHFAVI